MRIYVGQKLKPKPGVADWDDSMAEVQAEKDGRFRIILDENFGAWLTSEEIERDYEEVEAIDEKGTLLVSPPRPVNFVSMSFTVKDGEE